MSKILLSLIQLKKTRIKIIVSVLLQKAGAILALDGGININGNLIKMKYSISKMSNCSNHQIAGKLRLNQSKRSWMTIK